MAKKTVTVRRSEWARGGRNGDARLLNTNGCMCCLGFAICQITKIKKSDIDGEKMPEEVFNRKSFLTEEDGCNNSFAEEASFINDTKDLLEKHREKKLKDLFKKNDINLKFID